MPQSKVPTYRDCTLTEKSVRSEKLSEKIATELGSVPIFLGSEGLRGQYAHTESPTKI